MQFLENWARREYRFSGARSHPLFAVSLQDANTLSMLVRDPDHLDTALDDPEDSRISLPAATRSTSSLR
jgi:hypothetical protein